MPVTLPLPSTTPRTVPGRAARGRACAAALLLVGAAAGVPAPARAQTYALVMQGVLDGRSAIGSGGTAAPLAAASAFTLEAFFDVRAPNLVARIGVPGFVAYTPTAMRLTVGGRTYDVEPFDGAHPTGFAVAVFDSTTPFGVPHRYGVGVIQNPLADGAGLIADFAGVTSPLLIGAGGLTATTFTGYSGVGVTSGVCTAGTGANCQAHAVTPIPLTWAGQAFSLTLGSYDDNAPATPTFTASLVAVPEPGPLALVAAGLAAAAGLGAARRRGAREG